MHVSLIQALGEAKLLTEDSENVEYNRGVCELIANLFPSEDGTAEAAEKIANILGVRIR